MVELKSSTRANESTDMTWGFRGWRSRGVVEVGQRRARHQTRPSTFYSGDRAVSWEDGTQPSALTFPIYSRTRRDIGRESVVR